MICCQSRGIADEHDSWCGYSNKCVKAKQDASRRRGAEITRVGTLSRLAPFSSGVAARLPGEAADGCALHA